MTELTMLFLLKLTPPAGNCHYQDGTLKHAMKIQYTNVVVLSSSWPILETAVPKFKHLCNNEFVHHLNHH